MDRSDFLREIQQLSVWKSGSKRAPHKPLLILYALGQFRAGYTRLRFDQVDRELTPLLADFGVPQNPRALYPYFWLASSPIWQHGIPQELLPQRKGTEPRKRAMLAAEVEGGFDPHVIRLLHDDPGLVERAAQELLTAHFPPSLHEDLLQAVGLHLGEEHRDPGGRDPTFRAAVLEAYEYRCAACGFELSLGRNPIGVEAAHIKWVTAKGPDTVNNGLALCSLHHKLFDYGAWGLDTSLTMLVSDRARGYGARGLMELSHQSLRPPVQPDQQPAEPFLSWHLEQVFKGRPRP